jgi:hypothetical protein
MVRGIYLLLQKQSAVKQVLTILLSCLALSTMAQGKADGKIDPSKKVLTVDASCGQCKLGLKGKSCDLAVRIDGQAYYVDGTSIDQHGDAHADDGFCNRIRKANVQGEVVNNRFKATYFQLLPEEKKSAN